MTNIELLLRLVIMLLSLFSVGFFASMEAAFSMVDVLALTHLSSVATHQHLAGRALRLIQSREELLSTILIGTNLSIVIFTVSGTSIAQSVQMFGA
ncbi:MAG: CNNM domain-containing protein, partial [bacterium]|nr:CNNM domain-containing protein [bacterium]